jgi:XTP/dITP diphosphohydrolase
MEHKTKKLNTSNPGKFEEFKRLFEESGYTLEGTAVDLPEIDADHLTIVVNKASQLEEDIIVEDTSLEVEGAEFGTNIRWLLDHLQEYTGRKALWVVLLAVRQGNEILIYKGTVLGTIVNPKGTSGFGFDPFFLPEGATQTLAESKPDHFNARAQAVQALVTGNIWAKRPVMKQWKGPWQKK